MFLLIPLRPILHLLLERVGHGELLVLYGFLLALGGAELFELVEMKDVEIPQLMQRAMAKEAEAVREKRARLIKAEAEEQAADKLTDAAGKISTHPAALELRRMQMVAEVGVEHNTTTIILMPSDFVTLAKNLGDKLAGDSKT